MTTLEALCIMQTGWRGDIGQSEQIYREACDIVNTAARKVRLERQAEIIASELAKLGEPSRTTGHD